MNDNYSAGSINIEIPADEFKVHKSIYRGAIIRTGTTCKKFLYKSLLNSVWL